MVGYLCCVCVCASDLLFAYYFIIILSQVHNASLSTRWCGVLNWNELRSNVHSIYGDNLLQCTIQFKAHRNKAATDGIIECIFRFFFFLHLYVSPLFAAAAATAACFAAAVRSANELKNWHNLWWERQPCWNCVHSIFFFLSWSNKYSSAPCRVLQFYFLRLTLTSEPVAHIPFVSRCTGTWNEQPPLWINYIIRLTVIRNISIRMGWRWQSGFGNQAVWKCGALFVNLFGCISNFMRLLFGSPSALRQSFVEIVLSYTEHSAPDQVPPSTSEIYCIYIPYNNEIKLNCCYECLSYCFVLLSCLVLSCAVFLLFYNFLLFFVFVD